MAKFQIAIVYKYEVWLFKAAIKLCPILFSVLHWTPGILPSILIIAKYFTVYSQHNVRSRRATKAGR
jgi:hypothetical protein